VPVSLGDDFGVVDDAIFPDSTAVVEDNDGADDIAGGWEEGGVSVFSTEVAGAAAVPPVPLLGVCC